MPVCSICAGQDRTMLSHSDQTQPRPKPVQRQQDGDYDAYGYLPPTITVCRPTTLLHSGTNAIITYWEEEHLMSAPIYFHAGCFRLFGISSPPRQKSCRQQTSPQVHGTCHSTGGAQSRRASATCNVPTPSPSPSPAEVRPQPLGVGLG